MEMVDKTWIAHEKVFHKITPVAGLFEHKETNEIIFVTKEYSLDPIKLAENLKYNDEDVLTLRSLIEEQNWNELFCQLTRRQPQASDDFVKALAEIVKINEVYEDQQTPLHQAAEKCKPNVVEILVKRGARINALTRNLQTPLIFAVARDCLESAKILLRHGADPNRKDRWRCTALHHAAHDHDDTDLIEILLKFGAEIDPVDICNKTPLAKAVMYHNWKSVKALLTHKANPNIYQRNHGETILHFAAMYNQPDIIEILAKRKAGIENGIDALDNLLETPLIHAVQRGYLESATILLSLGADPNSKGRFGRTALHHAAQDHTDLIEILLKFGAEIDPVDENNDTPLAKAVMYHNWKSVKALLTHKANPNINRRNGETILQFAAKKMLLKLGTYNLGIGIVFWNAAMIVFIH